MPPKARFSFSQKLRICAVFQEHSKDFRALAAHTFT